MHEVHTPPFSGTRGTRGGAPVQGDVLAPPDAHPELQPVEPIEPADALAIHAPALPAQHGPDAEVPKPRPRMGPLPDPKPERDLILRSTPLILRCSTELRQPTGPRAADLKRHVKPSGQLPTTHGPQTFFRSASASVCLSSVRSATRRFSRLFSSSSCRRRRSSLTPKCAYFFFQAWKVASLTPAAGRRPRPGYRSRPGAGRRPPVPRRISSASSVPSFLGGPSKAPLYSSFGLSLFLGETSCRGRGGSVPRCDSSRRRQRNATTGRSVPARPRHALHADRRA